MPVNIKNAQIQMYDDSVKELAQETASTLKAVISQEKCKGKIATIEREGIDPSNPAVDAVDTTPINASSTLNALNAQMTPHMEGKYLRTLLSKGKVHWGYHFNTDEQLSTLLTKSSRLKGGNAHMNMKTDNKIITALFALNMSRQQQGTETIANEAFPKAQVRHIGNAAGTLGTWNVEAITELAALFEQNGANDQPIFCLMSPRLKQKLIITDKISNRDFMGSTSPLSSFELPDVAGIHFIVHPRVNTADSWNGSFAASPGEAAISAGGVNERIVLFQPDGICWGSWSGLETFMGRAPAYQFKEMAYMTEYGNACRPDDYRIVQCCVRENAIADNELL